jgi:CheY-like chemotaxis protein
MDFAPVLIIDDDSETVEAIQGILENAGYVTAVAADGFHGLRLAREVRPSVVVCDMVMPHMAGSDVFRTLSADPTMAGIPRVLISGHLDANCACADVFLPKPFASEDIVRVIGEVTKRASTSKPRKAPAEPDWHG